VTRRRRGLARARLGLTASDAPTPSRDANGPGIIMMIIIIISDDSDPDDGTDEAAPAAAPALTT
jgi:hypothetical protein